MKYMIGMGCHRAAYSDILSVQKSSQNVERWLREVHEHGGDVKCLLVGKKCDLTAEHAED